MKSRILALPLLLSAVLTIPAKADDVMDQINEALTAYGKKDVPTAIAGLEAALNLLRQARADSYGKLLPAPPAGWTADDVETVAAGLAALGGGTGASRKYHKGDDSVTVSILADSPMIQVLSAFASSGMAAMAGARTQIVNGRRTVYMKDEGSFSAIVGDRIVVRIEGRGLPEATLRQFLTAVDFTAVEKAGK